MNFKIHRGTKEIGGSCIEVWTENTRILLDFGMPLVGKDGKDFDFGKYKNSDTKELIRHGVLPDIKGLYDDTHKLINGVIISHAHQDHYGLINFINKKVKHYLGEATHQLIEISNTFTPQQINIGNTTYFEKERPFQIGDITITPYWADHSAFDAYSFLVEANGKSIFYSGDFRSHGRKANVFKWFLHHAPQHVDYLLLEGTNIGKANKANETEHDIEKKFIEIFKQPAKTNLVYTSGQNIDRLVSIYRACNNTGKTLVIDVYIASVLEVLSKYASIHHPSKSFENIKVIFSNYSGKRMNEEVKKKFLYPFRHYKISKEEIANQPDKMVMIVRPSMQKTLEKINGIDGGNLIYSMWEGYKQKSNTKKFLDYLTNRKFTITTIHTSGHADTEALKLMVDAIKPKNIIPIHTFNGSEYQKLFSFPVMEMKDGEIRQV